jgi:hypothetical protein
VLFALLLLVGVRAHQSAAAPSEYVIQISVDGLGSSYLQALLDQQQLPNFKRLQAEGSWTHNARTDSDFTVTLPNHTCMITGRPVHDKAASPRAILGHEWTLNDLPGSNNLHSVRQAYVKSAFDVAHDHGLRTAMFASKDKFVVYDDSYNAANGAPDIVGEDNGRDKLDLYVFDANCATMMDKFIEAMRGEPYHYVFVHFRDADSAGHATSWGSESYNSAVRAVDGYLGRMLDFVSSDPKLKDKTTLILSSDHGGKYANHADCRDPLDYTIPFYVWGAGVACGQNLYALNYKERKDPGSVQYEYTELGQPIRNGDGANLALWLLGLEAISESAMNAQQELVVDGTVCR